MKIVKIGILSFILLYVLSLNLSAQVTIGSGDPPHESALLDLQSSNKGFLISRVALTGRFDDLTIPNAVPGLLVLNTSQPDPNQPVDERVYPYRFYYWVDEGVLGPRWERFIGHDELEYKVDREIGRLAIPRPTLLYLNGSDMLTGTRPGARDFMRDIPFGSTKDIPLKDSINHSGGTVWLKENSTNTIVFEPGIYSIVFAYLFIPTDSNYVTCNVSSYFMEFPFYPKDGGARKDIRVYSNTYHGQKSKSSHAATINFVSPIREQTEWTVRLGAGSGDCTTRRGLSLPNRNTFLYITKVGDWDDI